MKRLLQTFLLSCCFGLVATLAGGYSAAEAQLSGPMDITGDGVGSSRVLSWTWTAQGDTATSFKEIKISRYTDGNSPFYMSAVTSQATISFLAITRGSMRIRMENARVISYSLGSSSETDPQTETFHVAFDRLVFTISGSPFCYDVVAQAAC